MDEKIEEEIHPFAGYTRKQLNSVSRFNKLVIEHTKELQKAIARERKKSKAVRDNTGGKL